MKTFFSILSVLLSLLFGRADTQTDTGSLQEQTTLTETASSDNTQDYSLNRDICLAAAQGYTFAGSENISSVSLRSNPTSRRTSPQTKSSFRIVKGGKVIDNNNLHPFLSPSFIRLSGLHISERYLFSICRLRI